MVPKYTQAEQVLMLENEIEVIGELIEASQKIIATNKTKNGYIHYKKWKGLLIAGCVMMFGTAISAFVLPLILTTLLSRIIAAAIANVGFITGVVFVALSAFCKIDGSDYRYQNSQLLRRIDHLQKIREAKKHQLDLLKQRVNNDKQKEETFVPIRELTIQERLHEMATLMDYIDKSFAEKMPVSETDAILQEIEETTKQKVLNMR